MSMKKRSSSEVSRNLRVYTIFSPEYLHKILSHFSSRTCCSAPAPSESLSHVWQCASENQNPHSRTFVWQCASENSLRTSPRRMIQHGIYALLPSKVFIIAVLGRNNINIFDSIRPTCSPEIQNPIQSSKYNHEVHTANSRCRRRRLLHQRHVGILGPSSR